jgi:pentatricopeptide repeat protein
MTNNNNFNMVRHYINVINRIAASCKIDAGVHAERLLFELINLSSSSSSSLLNGGKQGRVRGPDRNTYNAVMNAYAKSHSSSSTSTQSSNSGNNNNNNNSNSNDNSNNDAIANIERILQMMDTQSKLHGNNNPDAAAQITSDKISYTILLTAYASSSSTNNNNDDMGKKAEEILQHMTREYTVNGNMSLKADTVTYNAVMNAYAKAHSSSSTSTKCMNLLNDMLQRYNDTGDPDIRPDGVTFNTVLHAIANDASLGNSGSNSNDSNKKGLLVEDDDGDDDDDDDNSPPTRAVRLLEQMLLMGHQPDIITYNSILDAFAKHGSVDSARCAEVMLNNLEELYDETKNLQQQQHLEQECRSSTTSLWDVPCPDIYSYNIVINAWANCGQADKAVALLDRMSTRTRENKAILIPDVTTYNTILHSWSQSLDRNAPVKALGLLEVMIRLHNNSNIQIGDDDDDDDDNHPSNTVSTTSAATTTSTCILDVTSFSTVINSFAKSRYPRKARQARMLLTRLKSFNHGSGRAVGSMRRKNETLLRPNIYVYTAVLNACAYSYGSEKDESLRIGISTYEELQRSTELKTNHVAYGSFIRVCRKLMTENDPRRDHYITLAFKQCCLDGQLSDFVLRQLHPMPRLYNLLLKEYINDDNDDVRYTDLPPNWSVKVKDRTKQRRLSLEHHSKK